MDLHTKTAHELADLLRSRQISALDIAQDVFAHIDNVDGDVKGYITLTKDLALKQAQAVDDKLQNHEELPALAGIPVAIKDNICTDGIKTTCASNILKQFVPPYDATVIDKLNAAQIVMTGKTNMDEFAMGSSTENSGFFPTHNPWNLAAVPGGSSGGSAAVVAAGEAICALGSDTGGSIRQPASFCGVVGLKPTYGRVSRYGLVAYASSLDQIGPLTKDVTDCALMLNAIAGYDCKDSTSIPQDAPDYTQALRDDVKGLKIGVPREFFAEGVDPAVKQAIMDGIQKLVDMGAQCEELSLPHTPYAMPAYYLLAPAEASSNLARYDGVGYGYRAPETNDIVEMYMKSRSAGFGEEVKRRIMLGTYALSSGYYDAYYLKALKVRTLVKQDYDKAFEKYDVLITPVSPNPAWNLGAKAGDQLQVYLQDVCTIPVNLAGLPGISLPCGFTNGLPIGMQIIGKPLSEETLLRVAYSFEQNTDFHTRKPAGKGAI